MDKTPMPNPDDRASRAKPTSAAGFERKPEVRPLETRPVSSPAPLKTVPTAPAPIKSAPAPTPVKAAPAPIPLKATPLPTATVKPAPAAGTAKSASTSSKREAKFELYQCNARTVFLAGSFNAWNPQATPMKNNGSGKWEAALMLEPGRYEYRFVVDGKWIDDPLAKEKVPNPFEGANAILVLK